MTLHPNRLLQLNGNKFILILSFVLIYSNLFGDNAVHQKFKKALDNFYNKKYEQVILELNSKILSTPKLREDALVLLALSYYFVGNFTASDTVISTIEREFPKTNYKEKILDTKLGVGIQTKSKGKILNTIYSLDSLEIPTYRWKEYEQVFNKLFQIINENDLTILKNNLHNKTIKFALTKSLYNFYVDRLNSKRIFELYNDLIALNTQNSFYNISKIGVIIPQTPSQTKAEEMIIEGMKYSIDEFNRTSNAKLELLIFKDSFEKTEELLIQFSKDLEVICVVGPLYSEQFSRIAEYAHKLSLPIISPTATLTEIAHRSKYVYQFNPSIEIRGSAMAEYMLHKLSVTRVGVLTSRAQFIKPTYISFKKRMESEKNVDIVFDLNWDESPNSVKSIVRTIRKAALDNDYVIRFNHQLNESITQKLIRLGLDNLKIDSLKKIQAEVSVFELFGKYGDKICVSNKIPIFKRTINYIDSLHIPVYSIDAIYAPISNPKVVSVLANEIERQNIITRIAGNDIWYSLEHLIEGYPATNSVIFTADAFLDDENLKQQLIRDEISHIKNIRINRNFFYGYETLRKITGVFNMNVQRNNFYETLINDKKFEGIVSDIILNDDGINSAIFILEFKNKKIRKIDRVIVN